MRFALTALALAAALAPAHAATKPPLLQMSPEQIAKMPDKCINQAPVEQWGWNQKAFKATVTANKGRLPAAYQLAPIFNLNKAPGGALFWVQDLELSGQKETTFVVMLMTCVGPASSWGK